MPNAYQGHLWSERTIGLLGGSFNPAHDGHRHISLYALKQLGLDAVWWMVSPQNPSKLAKDTAPLSERIKIARRVSAHPKIIVTDIEQHLNTRYTIDTLKALHIHYPRTRFIWLMGSDNLQQFHLWHSWQEIFNNTPVCVMARPPRTSNIQSCPTLERFRSRLIPQEKARHLLTAPTPCWTFLHIPLNDISSTQIRENNKMNIGF